MEHELMDLVTREPMIDPVICNDQRAYCRFSVIEALLRASSFRGKKGEEVHTILFDDHSLRQIIDEKYPETVETRKAKRRELRESIEKHIKEGRPISAWKRLKFLKDFDQNPVEGEQQLIASQKLIEYAELVRKCSGVAFHPSEQQLQQITDTAFNILSEFQEAGYQRETLCSFGLRYNRFHLLHWTLPAKMGLLLLHGLTAKPQDNFFLNESSQCVEFIRSDAPVEWKRYVLDVFLLQDTHDSWIDYKLWVRIWVHCVQYPELAESRKRMYDQFMCSEKIYADFNFTLAGALASLANYDPNIGNLLTKLFNHDGKNCTGLKKDILLLADFLRPKGSESKLKLVEYTRGEDGELKPSAPEKPKRGRGRPRKNPLPPVSEAAATAAENLEDILEPASPVIISAEEADRNYERWVALRNATREGDLDTIMASVRTRAGAQSVPSSAPEERQNTSEAVETTGEEDARNPLDRSTNESAETSTTTEDLITQQREAANRFHQGVMGLQQQFQRRREQRTQLVHALENNQSADAHQNPVAPSEAEPSPMTQLERAQQQYNQTTNSIVQANDRMRERLQEFCQTLDEWNTGEQAPTAEAAIEPAPTAEAAIEQTQPATAAALQAGSESELEIPVVVPKRGRGRPRKNPIVPTTEADPAPPKRGRGRPRKHPIVPAIEETDTNPAPPKRGRGRPRKYPLSADQ
jgi:hypothetical protein